MTTDRRISERRTTDRRATPTTATDREYAVLATLAALIDPDAPQDTSYDAGFSAGLALARDTILSELVGSR
jgi:hypothetical protein